jgi:hypothetical protein
MLGNRRGPVAQPAYPSSTGTGPTSFRTAPRDPLDTQPDGKQTSHRWTHFWTQFASYTALLIVTAIIVVTVLVILNILRRDRLRFDSGMNTWSGDFEEAEELADAVAAATAALEHEGDTREAVIACYAAMERRITEAGVGRQTADTPEDLLRRATAAGLVPGTAGSRLTELFREARFSQHPMTTSHRALAREALTEISAHLQTVRPPQSVSAS